VEPITRSRTCLRSPYRRRPQDAPNGPLSLRHHDAGPSQPAREVRLEAELVGVAGVSELALLLVQDGRGVGERGEERGCGGQKPRRSSGPFVRDVGGRVGGDVV
jgi:hypothetical protein